MALVEKVLRLVETTSSTVEGLKKICKDTIYVREGNTEQGSEGIERGTRRRHCEVCALCLKIKKHMN
ncbi:hypothetical protein SESBI_23586 [Sesbania bispinosa]|nr:hypothetical protein SESBI_23586 [Sesbania bispinosa]